MNRTRDLLLLTALALLAAPLLPVAGHAQSVTLYTVEHLPSLSGGYTLGAWGPFQAPQPASAFIFGTLPASGVPAAEVAVEQHILHPGDEVPLPHFADGTVASESEIFWTAILWQATFGTAFNVNGRRDQYSPALDGRAGDVVRANFYGRTYSGGSGLLSPLTEPFNTASSVDVMVTVIAVRSSGTTPGKQPSWGSLKARYR